MCAENEGIPQTDPVTCLRCGGRHLMESVGLVAYPQGGGVKAYVSKAGFLNMPVPTYGDVAARICADCGHTELVTGNLADLWKAYSQENR